MADQILTDYDLWALCCAGVIVCGAMLLYHLLPNADVSLTHRRDEQEQRMRRTAEALPFKGHDRRARQLSAVVSLTDRKRA